MKDPGNGLSSLFSRRRFLQTAGASVVLTRSGWARGFAPSDRITIGVIGWGMMGPANTKAFLTMDDCQVVAACELDGKKMQEALATINGHYGNQDCKPYHDYREMIARTDIDAIMIAVPDQWHAMIATEAAAHKKDIYGEKPLARTIFEQQAIVRAVEKNNVIWQTGSWQRSLPSFHKAAEIVRNGLIGDVTHVEVGLPGGHHDFPGTVPALMEKLAALPNKPESPAQIVPGTPAWDLAVSEPPSDFDYATWIGPSKMEPYIAVRVYQNWRWNYNTGGGQLMDWIGHHGDIAHWGLGFDRTGPSVVEGHGEFPAENAVWNTATKFTIECLYRKEVTGYPVDVTMTIAGGSPAIAMGTKWIGKDGWVWVDRSGFDASNPAWVKQESLPDAERKVQLDRIGGASAEFSRQRAIAEADDHAGGDGASLNDSGASGTDLDADRAEDRVGREEGDDPERCGRERAADAAVSGAVQTQLRSGYRLQGTGYSARSTELRRTTTTRKL